MRRAAIQEISLLHALQLIAANDDAVKNHLEQPAMRNCTYKSPKIQNDIIEIIGKDIIQKKIVSEITEARFYSILADEVTSHNKEELSLCIRFLDKADTIREEFLEFVKLPRITGEHIASAVTTNLNTLGLPLENIRGQGYDGAANMASEKVGVQGRIRREAPLAIYVHCSGHALNLVITTRAPCQQFATC